MEQDFNSYLLSLGKLYGNFHSLEFALRAYLYSRDPTIPFEHGVDLGQLKVGQDVPLNAFTNFDSLGKLISKFNVYMAEHRPSEIIDSTIVDLRDALAHGRVSGATSALPLRLLTFSAPKRDAVRVTWSEELSPTWLDQQRLRVFNELMKVLRNLGPPA